MDFNKDYYTTLGVNKDASQDEIKSNYRKLAKEYHPDATQNHDDTKFKELSEAYSVVGDEQERQKYDAHSPQRRYPVVR